MLRRILLVLAVASVLAFLLVVLVQKEKDQERDERTDARLVDFDERSVPGFVLTTREGGFRFERVGMSWRMTAPVEDAADAAAVQRLLGALRRVRVERTISDPEALSSYGLDPPVASIEILGEAEVPRVDIGDADPTGDGLFGSVAGRSGVLVLGLPEAFVLGDPSPVGLRDGTLLGVLVNEVAKIELREGSKALTLAREEDGWWIVEPGRIPASDVAVRTLLTSLEATPVKVLDDRTDPSDPALGLGADALRVSLGTPAGRREIVLGSIGADGLRAVRRDDRASVLFVDGSSLAEPVPEPAAFADVKLTKANRYRVVAFTDKGPHGEFRATRDGSSAWTDGAGQPFPEDSVLGFLARLLEAPVSEIVPSTDGGVVRTVSYRLEDGTEERIEVLSAGGARRGSLPGAVFRLRAGLPEPLRGAGQ